MLRSQVKLSYHTKTQREDDNAHMNPITSLLEMGDMEVIAVKNGTDSICLAVEKKQETQVCPRCGALTELVHDYRTQRVRDLPVQGKTVYWDYRKRRYRCSCCEKRFYEKCPLLPKYHRITNRVAFSALDELSRKQSMKDIAERLNVSSSSVARYLRSQHFGRPDTLPEVISIDEFRGNTEFGRFQTIITDLKRQKVFDILPNNEEHTIFEYFRRFENRDRVRYFVSDMKKEYVRIAKLLFPNATIVTDRFHVLRYACFALENVRKRVQKDLSREFRLYFKRSRLLLLKHRDKLTPFSMNRVSRMLEICPELRDAYLLKEKMYSLFASEDYETAKKRFSEFMLFAGVAEIPEYRECTTMMTNWAPLILNAFRCRYSNGFTEGCNNTIKVIKRTGYGYRNFENFRSRILMILNRGK